MSNSRWPHRLRHFLPNLQVLTVRELEVYREHIQKRSLKQMGWLFLYALILMGLGIAATWLTPEWLGSLLAILLCGTSCLTIPIFMNPQHFLPFKFTRTAPATIYRWKTRQVPEWMYRGCKRAGFFCLLYGDALLQEHPKSKVDL